LAPHHGVQWADLVLDQSVRAAVLFSGAASKGVVPACGCVLELNTRKMGRSSCLNLSVSFGIFPMKHKGLDPESIQGCALTSKSFCMLYIEFYNAVQVYL